MTKLAAILLAVLAAAAIAPARAQTFPERPVKRIVAYPPGGPIDLLARLRLLARLGPETRIVIG